MLDLQRFCSRDTTRRAICQPWTAGGYRFATDGRIMVKVHVPDEPDEHREGYLPPTKGALEIFAEYRPEVFLPVELPTVVGSVEEALETCPECEGKGSFSFEGRPYLLVCEDCDGYGRKAHWTCAEVAGVPVSLGVIHLLKSLDGVVVYQPSAKSVADSRLYFTFSQGEGVVGGLKQDMSRANDYPWPGPESFGLPRKHPWTEGRDA